MHSLRRIRSSLALSKFCVNIKATFRTIRFNRQKIEREHRPYNLGPAIEQFVHYDLNRCCRPTIFQKRIDWTETNLLNVHLFIFLVVDPDVRQSSDYLEIRQSLEVLL